MPYITIPSWKYGQYVAGVLATASVFVTSQCLGWPSGAIPKIDQGTAGFELTEVQKTFLVCLPNLGAIISPIPCGYLINQIGRKTMLTYSISLVAVAWVILAFSKTVWLILSARFLMGLTIGVEFTTVSIYIAEVVDPDIRGSIISLTGLMLNLGVFYVSGASFADYQTMTLLCLISPVCQVFGFLLIPESPYFFLMHGRREEAEKSIVWLRGECRPEDLNRIETAVKEQLSKRGTFSEIFSSPSNRRGFFTVECLKMCAATSATVLLFPFSTEILPYGWISPHQSYFVLTSVWVVSSLISSALVYRFSRRFLMMVSTIGSISMLILTACWYYLRDVSKYDTSTTSWLPLILLCLATFFESLGITFIATLLQGELFPMNIKSKACALASMTSYFFDSISYLLFYLINSRIGMWFNFAKSAGTATICLFVTLFIMMETKGRTLEDIQNVVNTPLSTIS